MTAGPWQDDADPVWEVVASCDSSTDNCVTQTQLVSVFGSSATAAAETAWSLADLSSSNLYSGGDTSHGSGKFYEQVNSSGSITCEWNQIWVTITTADVTVTSSTLPASVYDPATGYTDPTVTGVEWESTSTPLAQQMSVSLVYGNYAPTAIGPGDVYTVHVGPSGTGPYAPGWLTAQQVRAMPSPGSITVAADGTYDWFTFTPDLPLTVGASMGVTLLDPYTEAGTAYSSVPGNRDYPLWVRLHRQYRPRYRLLYGSRRVVPIRQVQRGGDGLGMSSAPRAIQRSSRQGTLRNISYL